jgi:hypothetical protein
MTREEALKKIKAEIRMYDEESPESVEWEECYEALEQEPCEDCISRQAMLDMATTIQTDDFSGNEIIEVVTVEDIKELPSVTSQPKTSWIPVSEKLPNLDDYTGSKVWQKKVLITCYLSFDDTKELFVSEAFAKDVTCNSVHDTVVVAWMPLPLPYKTESEKI